MWRLDIPAAVFILWKFFARPIAAVSNSDKTALVDLSAQVIRLFNLLLPIVPLQVLTTSFFQAINKPLKAAFLSLSRQVLLVIPLVLILPLFWGLTGVFLAPVFADAISVTMSVIMIKNFFDKHGQNFFFSKKHSPARRKA